MGLTNTPLAFQHLMNNLFHNLSDQYIVVYLDNIFIYSDNCGQHHKHVCEVLHHLHKATLLSKPEKCDFHTTSVKYLGVIISPNGVAMDWSKVEVIRAWPPP
jgi:hypothetical protein